MKRFFVINNTDPDGIGDLLYLKFNKEKNTVEIDFKGGPDDVSLIAEDVPELINRLITACEIMRDRLYRLGESYEPK